MKTPGRAEWVMARSVAGRPRPLTHGLHTARLCWVSGARRPWSGREVAGREECKEKKRVVCVLCARAWCRGGLGDKCVEAADAHACASLVSLSWSLSLFLALFLSPLAFGAPGLFSPPVFPRFPHTHTHTLSLPPRTTSAPRHQVPPGVVGKRGLPCLGNAQSAGPGGGWPSHAMHPLAPSLTTRCGATSRPHTPRPRPARPRCAAAGCTWPGAPTGRARPS